MVRRSSAAPGTLACCPWWTLGGGALVAAATVTFAGLSGSREGAVRASGVEGSIDMLLDGPEAGRGLPAGVPQSSEAEGDGAGGADAYDVSRASGRALGVQ